MKRFMYRNIIISLLNFIILTIIVINLIMFMLGNLIDKRININNLIVISVSILAYITIYVIVAILDNLSKKRIIFKKNQIIINDKSYYVNECKMRYFTFKISLLEPSFEFPKLVINTYDGQVIVYITKFDYLKLKKIYVINLVR